MEVELLKEILLIFVVAIPTVILAHRARTPALVGFIITGVLIGPTGLGLIDDLKRIEQIAQIGVAFLLFSIGLELSFSKLASVKAIALGGGALQILLTGLIAPVLAWGMGWSRLEQIYFGCIIALSSTALVMSVLSGRRMVDSLAGRVSAGVLVLQDLSLAPMMVFLTLLSSETSSSFGHPLFMALVKVLLLFLILFLGGRFILAPLADQVAKTRSRELFLCFVIAFALGVALLTEQWGLSFSFGAFLAGLLLSQTEYRFQALSEISTFRYVFSSIFFVSIGMLIDLHYLSDHLLMVIGLSLAVWVLKMLITAGSLRIFGLPWSVSSQVGLSLGQVGEFSFLILMLGKAMGVLQAEFYQLCLSVVSLTLMLTPFGVRFSPTVARFFARAGARASKEENAPSSRPEGHVIICGFGPLGQSLGKMLKKRRIPYLVLELNPQTVKKMKKEIPILFGDGSSAEILYESGIEKARALAVAAPDFINAVAIIEQAKKMNPHLPLITRARYRSEVEELYRVGADVVVSEELEAGVEMGRYLLLQLGIPHEEVDGFVKEIRDFGSADFF